MFVCAESVCVSVCVRQNIMAKNLIVFSEFFACVCTCDIACVHVCVNGWSGEHTHTSEHIYTHPQTPANRTEGSERVNGGCKVAVAISFLSFTLLISLFSKDGVQLPGSS